MVVEVENGGGEEFMNKNNVIMILAVGAGGYLLYWYLTKHGPTGPAYDTAGNKIAPSYWDTWFGAPNATPAGTGAGLPSAPAQNPLATSATGAPPATSYQAPIPPVQHAPQFADAALQTLRNNMYAASGNQPALNADQWSYYMTQVLGGNNALTAEQFGAAFPGLTDTNRGGTMTADQFLIALYKSQHSGAAPGMSGFGDIVSTNRPSMAFSNARRTAFAGKGSYIQ